MFSFAILLDKGMSSTCFDPVQVVSHVRRGLPDTQVFGKMASTKVTFYTVLVSQKFLNFKMETLLTSCGHLIGHPLVVCVESWSVFEVVRVWRLTGFWSLLQSLFSVGFLVHFYWLPCRLGIQGSGLADVSSKSVIVCLMGQFFLVLLLRVVCLAIYLLLLLLWFVCCEHLVFSGALCTSHVYSALAIIYLVSL